MEILELEIVLLVGAARSGTTLLGDKLLSVDPRIGYVGEANFVWRYGAAFARTELRHTARRQEIEYIRKWFRRYAEKRDCRIIVDKTLSNCLRIPYCLQVFPNAKIVHLVRDGRAAALSAAREWSGSGINALDSRDLREASKLRKLGMTLIRESRLADRVNDARSLVELAADAPRALRAFDRILRPGVARLWGPRVPGLKEMMERLPLLDICGLQWDWCVRMAHFSGRQLPQEQYFVLRYEDLLGNTREVLSRLYEFVGLSIDDATLDARKAAIRTSDNEWKKEADPGDVHRLGQMLQPTLHLFGYGT